MIKGYIPVNAYCMDIVIKVFRFISIYGFPRTIIKVAGRTRVLWLRFFFKSTYLHRKKDMSLIGCGQFGFSTISFFIQKAFGNRFRNCYDINTDMSLSCSKFWGYGMEYDVNQLITAPENKYIFIASDHFSHTEYAIRALEAGKDVHLEKPISVTKEQLRNLLKAQKESSGHLYAGYNRPYSKAIQKIDREIKGNGLPLSLGCFVIGHKIGRDHWYRMPKEGTRVCGNLGHWLDLSIHLFNSRGQLPRTLRINVIQADKNDVDDNFTISYSTDVGDLVSITLTSRGEPFEGIRENINIQCGEMIAVIDDFRKMTLLHGAKRRKYMYWPKDVGHQRSIMQVFSKINREWIEVVYSTLLMLKIKDMVLAGEDYLEYNILHDYQDIIKSR